MNEYNNVKNGIEDARRSELVTDSITNNAHEDS